MNRTIRRRVSRSYLKHPLNSTVYHLPNPASNAYQLPDPTSNACQLPDLSCNAHQLPSPSSDACCGSTESHCLGFRVYSSPVITAARANSVCTSCHMRVLIPQLQMRGYGAYGMHFAPPCSIARPCFFPDREEGERRSKGKRVLPCSLPHFRPSGVLTSPPCPLSLHHMSTLPSSLTVILRPVVNCHVSCRRCGTACLPFRCRDDGLE